MSFKSKTKHFFSNGENQIIFVVVKYGNFFDTILQQKEGFSPYVWEDKALEILNNNPELKATFEQRKKDLPEFNNNWYAQLDWLHKQTEFYEKAHLQYPIYRIHS